MRSFFLFFILCSQLATAQIFECVDYQKAVDSQTRSRTGIPGVDYWQNSADYHLTAQVNPEDKSLHGNATIIYYNNSPDTLQAITLKLYQNVYEKGAVRNVKIDHRDLHDGVIMESLLIDDIVYIEQNTAKQSSKVNLEGSNLNINIQENLLPGNSVKIEVAWQLDIPAHSSQRKMGYYKEGAFFIGLWYPQVAVYDDISGWDNGITYSGIQDFYNDFSNYEVFITVPEDYLLWGTGTIINEDEVYSPEILNQLNKARTTNEIVTIVDEKAAAEPESRENKMWHFSASNVTDFAFGMANNYLWEAGSVVSNNNSNERTFLEFVYHPDNNGFAGQTNLAKKSIKYFAEELPGYPFPFPKATIFNGLPVNTLAVEYPMIANISYFSDEVFFKSMIIHKLFHNYFPFYMGINEKNCIWMDEGWAFYIADKIVDEEFLPYSISEIYSKHVGRSRDMPLMASSTYVIENNLPTQYFLKPYMAYYLLEQLLGTEQFQFVLAEYIDRWHGKHPTPYDFFYTVEDCLNQDLSWLWNPLFFEFGYPDLNIKEVNKGHIIIEKAGVVPVPIKLTVTYEDGSTQIIEKNIKVWQDNDTQVTLQLPTNKIVSKVVLGDENIPDVNENNNIYNANL